MWMRTRCIVSLLAAVSLAACGSPPVAFDGGTGGGGGEVGGGGGQTGGGGGGGGAVGGGGGADVLAPAIRSTSPASGAVNQALDVAVLVAFSEPMDLETVTVSIFPAIEFTGPDFDADGVNMTLVPSAPLAPATLYTVIIDGADLAGNMLAGARQFTFTTMVVDVIDPAVEATIPLENDTGVSISSPLSVTFSESMDLATVNVDIMPTVELGPGVWTGDNKTITFTPPHGFAPSTLYTVTLTGKDPAGNDLGSSGTFSFTTGLAPDVTPPTVLDTAPGDGDTGVSNNALIAIQFSEPMRQLDTEAALLVQAGAATLTSCTARWLWNAQRTIASCQPNPVLAFSTPHRVIIGTGAKDDAGLPLAAAYAFSFTTGAAPDLTPPTVSSVSPGLGAIGVERTAYVQVSFSEAMDTAATQGAFACAIGATPVGGSFTWYTHSRVLRFTPASDFVNGVTVSCSVRGGSIGARDVAGNRLAASYPWTFRVLRAGAIVAPPIAALDGYVYNTGTTHVTLPSTYVGDTSSNLSARAFFTFSLASLPGETRRITGAVAYLYLIGPVGTPSTLGNLYLEHLDFGPSLSGTDFSLAALSSAVWATPYTAGFHPVSVTSAVQNDFLNRVSRENRVEFRLRFATDVTADGAYDGVNLAATEWASATQRPYLAVGFEYP